jgi:hypothetical protein
MAHHGSIYSSIWTQSDREKGRQEFREVRPRMSSYLGNNNGGLGGASGSFGFTCRRGMARLGRGRREAHGVAAATRNRTVVLCAVDFCCCVLISSLRLFLLREEEQPRDRGRMNGETGSECGVCSGFSFVRTLEMSGGAGKAWTPRGETFLCSQPRQFRTSVQTQLRH